MLDFIRRLFNIGTEESEATGALTPDVTTEPRPPDYGTRPLPPLDDDEVATSTQPLGEDGSAPASTRKLGDAPEFALALKRFLFGATTDIGQVRSINQDALSAFAGAIDSTDSQPDFGLFVVADGMGGHLDGDKAAALAAKTVSEHVLEKIYIPLVKQEGGSSEQPSIGEVLTTAIQAANSAILTQVPNSGTTVTAALLLGNLAHIAHVGDSRAYVINPDSIERITRDHSLVQRLIEIGQITKEEAEVHERRNELYRVLGMGGPTELEVDITTRRLRSGERLLLCSDGLWGMVDESAIRDVVLASPHPQAACDKLIGMANKNGGHDNITVIIIQMPNR